MEGSKTAFVLDDIRAQFKVFEKSLDKMGNELKEKITELREKGKEGYPEVQAPTCNLEGEKRKKSA